MGDHGGIAGPVGHLDGVQGFGEAVSYTHLDVYKRQILEGTVTEVNKGGIVVNVKGIRVFVPASQTGMPRGADLSEMIKRCV